MKTSRSQKISLKRNDLNTTIKTQISSLGSKAKVCMDENQILINMIKEQSNFLSRSKKNLKKYATNNNINKDILKDLKIGNKDISEINKSLRTKHSSLRLRFHNLAKNMEKNLNSLKNELILLSDRKFIFENALIAKDVAINSLKVTIDNIIANPYEREKLREIYSKDLDSDEDEMLKVLDSYQAILLSELKSFNRTNLKCVNLTKKKDELNKQKRKIESNNFSYNSEIKISVNVGKENSKNNLSKSSINDDINLNIIDESSSFIEEDSNLEDSRLDYDSLDFEDKVNIKNNLKGKNYGLLLKIPVIDLKQIEFNKRKVKQEDAEKSLSREFEDSESELKMKIKNIKSKIKTINNKINKKKIFLKELKKKIIILRKNNFRNLPNISDLTSLSNEKSLIDDKKLLNEIELIK